MPITPKFHEEFVQRKFIEFFKANEVDFKNFNNNDDYNKAVKELWKKKEIKKSINENINQDELLNYIDEDGTIVLAVEASQYMRETREGLQSGEIKATEYFHYPLSKSELHINKIQSDIEKLISYAQGNQVDNFLKLLKDLGKFLASLEKSELDKILPKLKLDQNKMVQLTNNAWNMIDASFSLLRSKQEESSIQKAYAAITIFYDVVAKAQREAYGAHTINKNSNEYDAIKKQMTEKLEGRWLKMPGFLTFSPSNNNNNNNINSEKQEKKSKPCFVEANKNEAHNYLFYYLVIGDNACGKTNLIMRETDDTFLQAYPSTIGQAGKQMKKKHAETKEVIIARINELDNVKYTNGVPYHNRNGIMLTFDITDADSFKSVKEQFLSDIKRYASPDVAIVLVGLKSDRAEKRAVSHREAQAFAQSINVNYVEASAKTGENVSYAWSLLMLKTLEKRKALELEQKSPIKQGRL